MRGRLVEQTRMRAGIARRMQDSKREAPHFYVQAEVGVDALTIEIERLNATEPDARITMTAALARGCFIALEAHPAFNAVWTDDGLLEADELNLGIAVALDGGLLAPALVDAAHLELPELAAALRDLVERTRAGRLRQREMTESTFTLSNLGMFGVSAFTSIITPPQVAALATARPTARVVRRAGALVEEARMTVTLSADHRAVDGASAARWLETFTAAIESPTLLLASPAQEALS